jgi:hypothetical protein
MEVICAVFSVHDFTKALQERSGLRSSLAPAHVLSNACQGSARGVYMSEGVLRRCSRQTLAEASQEGVASDRRWRHRSRGNGEGTL